MNPTVIKFKTWLKGKDLYSKNDFYSYHQNDWFSTEKLREIFSDYDLEIPPDIIQPFDNLHYIKLSDVERLVKTKLNVRDYWIGDLLEVFGLVKVNKSNQITYICEPKVKLTEQYKFTYTIWKWIQANYPELEIKIEENFLSRFIPKIGSCQGPRVDIVIDSIKIVIEYDEPQHEEQDHADKDSIRDKIIQAFGYQVLRFKEKEQKSIFQFIKELNQVIKTQDLKENPKKFASFIIDFFVTQGYSQDIVEKLSQEVIDDIISKVPYEQIGDTPKKIRLSKDVFNWLKIKDSAEKKAIRELLVESIDENLYVESPDDPDDYILSPNAFELILAKLDPNDYLVIEDVRKCYIGIKNKLYHFIYSMYVDLKQDTSNRIKLLRYVNDDGYSRGEKNAEIKIKKLQKTIEKLEKENQHLKKIIIGKYPRDARGLKRTTPPAVQSILSVNKPIVSELPELIYTGEQDDYVEEDEIKTIFEINKSKFKTSKTTKSILQEIKKKIKQEDLSNTLVAGFIFKCKIVYTEESDGSDDSDLDTYKNPILPNKQVCQAESDEEEFIIPPKQPKQPRSKTTTKKVSDFIDDSESDNEDF